MGAAVWGAIVWEATVGATDLGAWNPLSCLGFCIDFDCFLVGGYSLRRLQPGGVQSLRPILEPFDVDCCFDLVFK